MKHPFAYEKEIKIIYLKKLWSCNHYPFHQHKKIEDAKACIKRDKTIAKRNERYKMILFKRDEEKKTFAEIAEILKITPSAVKSAYYVARWKQMRELL